MCLTPLGTGRLYDNQLHCNLHLILFYEKKELYKEQRRNRKVENYVWEKCQTRRKANRSFFACLFVF